MGKEAEGGASVGMAVGGDVVCSGGREVTEEEQTGNVVELKKIILLVPPSDYKNTQNNPPLKSLFLPIELGLIYTVLDKTSY